MRRGMAVTLLIGAMVVSGGVATLDQGRRIARAIAALPFFRTAGRNPAHT
jgi:hypothetical protein